VDLRWNGRYEEFDLELKQPLYNVVGEHDGFKGLTTLGRGPSFAVREGHIFECCHAKLVSQ
jgi:hypothetical protein